MTFGVASMTAPLREVALRRPGKSIVRAEPSAWNYSEHFDPSKIESEYDRFVLALENFGVKIHWIKGDDLGNADSVFAYDASLMTPQGAILMSPGKEKRRGEEGLHKSFYINKEIPIIGQIDAPGTAEAGDTLWLDENTVIIGKGFRTNTLGAEQVKDILNSIGITCHIFDLPFYQGKKACLHLMSLISMVDTKSALVYEPLLPVGLWKLLDKKSVKIISAPENEFFESDTLSTNVLAIAPGACLMLDNLPKTAKVLRNSGIKVTTFRAPALCIGCEGGPTCLTRPLYRI
ncbi:arginine deiminase family protein [Paracoccaceae bacterium]|nr:arginine deiminase family protein [Paracoccaceae bacterium]